MPETRANTEQALLHERNLLARELVSLAVTLDDTQPHISGERYLMSPEKVVLLGKNAEGERVVIKASRHRHGKVEIQQEKKIRDAIQKLAFAKDTLLMPEERYFGDIGDYSVFITSYIPQEKAFVMQSLEEQFFSTLRAFEAQEAFHATTWEHRKMITGTFLEFSSKEYLREFKKYARTIHDAAKDEKLDAVVAQAEHFLATHKDDIDRYCGYLTHTDFVPHNFRTKEKQIYVLDSGAFVFGNKHEGWARFLNFMLVHNPELEHKLTEHLRTSRGENEYLVLRLMRVYKMGLLLNYYAKSLLQTEGDLHLLTQKRIVFWTQALACVLKDTPLPAEVRQEYLDARNALRTPEEKDRQKEITHT